MRAIEIVAAVKAGQLRALDVLNEHLAVIENQDHEVHAYNLVTTESARGEAAAIDARLASGEPVGPLAGVPLAMKDNICTKGIPTTCSSKILEGWLPPYDATVVRQLKKAGAVVVGKTNLDEFAMGSSTEHSAFGPTRNPHDLSRVPGGSSGGSAASVAAGFTPLAIGSDTGGSIRQPAAFCGVVGMKPTYGVVSRYGLVAFASSLDQVGPLANNVADAALLFDVIAAHDPLDSTSISDFVPNASAALDEGVDGMRIGVVRELAGGLGSVSGISTDVLKRTACAVEVLAAAGAVVEEVSVPSSTLGLSAYYLLAPAEASSNLSRYDGVRYGTRINAETAPEMTTATRTAGFGDEVKRRIMLGTYALSAGYYDAFYAKALKVRTMMINEFAGVYENFDVLVTPTAPTTAFELGARSQDPLTMYINDVCTIPSNLTGHPAISVPFGLGDDRMPVGVQVLAPALHDAQTFRVAAVLEAAMNAMNAMNAMDSNEVSAGQEAELGGSAGQMPESGGSAQ